MPDTAWIDARSATQRLGVKPQTLYAYVSRGLVSARPDETDPRASLYATADIAALVRRRRAGRRREDIAKRTISWGEPVLESAIATVRQGRLIYRGVDAVELSERATLEQTALLLWAQKAAPPLVKKTRNAAIAGPSAKARGLAFLAQRAASDAPSFGRSPGALAAEAYDLLTGMGDALAGERGAGPMHVRLAETWDVSKRQADLIRRALVLIADHELNASTFAARVAASTGASLAAAALAGYATLTGPLHGEASTRALVFLEEAQERGADEAAHALFARGEKAPAVGHALYPNGDPRAAALLEALAPRGALAAAIEAAEAATGERSNIDMALAALTLQLGLPREAPFVLFAAGRMAGWLAHAMEQRETGRVIRPRATYTGFKLRGAAASSSGAPNGRCSRQGCARDNPDARARLPRKGPQDRRS